MVARLESEEQTITDIRLVRPGTRGGYLHVASKDKFLKPGNKELIIRAHIASQIRQHTQNRILTEKSFTDLKGDIQGFYIHPMQVIVEMESYKRQHPNSYLTETLNNTIEDGFQKMYVLSGRDQKSVDRKRRGLKLLKKVFDAREKELTGHYVKGRLPQKDYERGMEHVIGVQLAVTAELKPKKLYIMQKNAQGK